jgi:hypothetical protein
MLVRRDGQIVEARLAWREGVRGYMRPRLLAGELLVDPPGEGIELLEAGYTIAGGHLELVER